MESRPINVEHDAVLETNNVIETPSWSKFDPKTVELTESDENTDDNVYAELHSPFEERERRRYVMSTLSGDDPFVLGFSAIQFMQVEPKEQLEMTYNYPQIKPLNRIDQDINEIMEKEWKCSATGGFCVNFNCLK